MAVLEQSERILVSTNIAKTQIGLAADASSNQREVKRWPELWEQFQVVLQMSSVDDCLSEYPTGYQAVRDAS